LSLSKGTATDKIPLAKELKQASATWQKPREGVLAVGRQAMKLFRLSALVFLTSFSTDIAAAHEHWADGSRVPGWVKQMCCDSSDFHQLTLRQIKRVQGGWSVEGHNWVVPDDRVLPSEDDSVWIFYRTYPDGA
jgi:hypothetical protein